MASAWPKGRDTKSANNLAPAAVMVSSKQASKLPLRSPFWAFTNSKLLRVAASINKPSEWLSSLGFRKWGMLPTWVILI